MQKIGDWHVRADTNELLRAGEAIRVEPKAMDVLVLLARHAGRTLTREELLKEIWPGVVVGDEALTQAIIKLRRALGDDSRAPRYIETIPKRGYRLIAPVSSGESQRPAGRLRSRSFAVAATAVACALAACAVVAIFRDDASPAAGRRAERARNVQAQVLFERGQAALLVRHASENEEARWLFRQSIELDPTFARAYAGLAMTYALEPRLGGRDRSVRALELAETARLMAPGVAEPYWVVGFVHVQERRYSEAIGALEKAIELDPAFADAYALLGGVYTYIGRPKDSIPLLRTALRLNPDGGYLYFLLLGRAYLFDNDVEQAIINLRAAALRNPVDVETRIFLAAALAAGGERSGARWESDEIRALRPGFSAKTWLASYPMSDDRQEKRLAALLADVGL